MLFVATMLLVPVASFAQQLPADKIIGIWLSQNSDVELKFEIYKSEGKYFGKLLYASTMYEEDGKTPKKDFKNPDRNLHSRSRQNIVNITNLTYNEGEYIGGKLYNPDNGSSYSLKAKLKSVNELEFRGYMGVSLLGKTIKFKRVQ